MTSETNGKTPEKKRKAKMSAKKKGIIWAVIIVVVAGGGFGFWRWHETPAFCAAICHNMDQYLDGYNQEQGKAGVDKYGNAGYNLIIWFLVISCVIIVLNAIWVLSHKKKCEAGLRVHPREAAKQDAA